MTSLLKLDVKFNWNDNCQQAFDKLKKIIISEPILQYVDFKKKLILTTDASAFGISAVLSQGKIGEDLPIAFLSRTLQDTETRFSTTEREMLAIYWGIKQFRPYLYGIEFLVETDHKPLEWIYKAKDSFNKLYRWRVQLADYNFTVIYKPGKYNVNADALSRIRPTNTMPIPEINVITRTGKNTKETQKENYTKNINITEKSYDDCIKYIQQHFDYGKEVDEQSIININTKNIKNQFFFVPNTPNNNVNLNNKNNIAWKSENENYFFYLITHNNLDYKLLFELIYDLKLILFENNIEIISYVKEDKFFPNIEYTKLKQILRYLLKNTNIQLTIYLNSIMTITNKNDISQLIREYHDSLVGGHTGYKRTIDRLKENYYWPNMKSDIKNYVQTCDACQRNKNTRKTRMPMVITTTSRKPFEKIFLDIVGPLPQTINGYQYLLTFQDDLTRFVDAIPLENQEADTVARAYTTNIILKYGTPLSILTDRGSNFQSDLMKRVCKLLRIRKIQTSAYHPESNGALERSHKTLKEYLRNYVNKNLNDWDNHIPFAIFMYNTTPHTSTKYSPFELMFGFKANIPISVSKNPEVVYNYDDYYYELKYKLQSAHKFARENLINSKISNKKQFDRKTNPLKLKIGDKVLLENTTNKKLGAKFDGPYDVIDILSDVNTKIKIKNNEKVVHNNRLKLYFDN